MMSTSKKEKNQHINVFVRVRPLNKLEGSTNVIEIRGNRELFIKHHATARSYIFDRVFGPESRQIELYKMVAEPTVSEVINGYNCTVLAYGQTGTGKTYTMAGGAVANVSTDQAKTPWFEDVHAGIIPRTLAHMFDELRMQQLEYTVRVSYLELYNEEIFDLLSPVDDSTKLKLYDDSLKKGSVIVQGLTECNVNSKAEVYRILEKGAEKRRVAATLMNSQSSRSHTVFCITVHTKENSVDGEDLLKTGKLYLVDLAGSENIKQSGATELRAREAFSINQSLLTLGRCIVKLMERSAHIPYRESKLTRLLQDSLGGRTKTTLIATVSPAFMNTDETMNTLDYAGRAKHITNKPEVNQRMSKTALLKEYTEEIERLRRDLNASRMGKGVYLDKDNYDSLVKERDSQKDEIAEKIGMIRVLQEEMDRKEETCNTLKMTLVEHQREVETKVIVIETLEKQIEQASREIDELSVENNIKQYIVSKHCETEHLLQVTAKKLLDVAEVSTADTEKLHDKLEAVTELNKQNKAVCEKYITEFNNKITVIENKVSDFHQRENAFHGSMASIVGMLESMGKAFAIQRAQFDEQMKNLLSDTSGFSSHASQEYGEFKSEIKHGMATIKETVASNETAIVQRCRNEILPLLGQHMDLINNFRQSVDLTCTAIKDTLAGNQLSTTRFVCGLKDKIEIAKQDTINFIQDRKVDISNYQDDLLASLKCQEMEEDDIEQKFTQALNLFNDAKAMTMEHIKRDKLQKIHCLQNFETVSDSLSVSKAQLNAFFDETSTTADTLHSDVSGFTAANEEHFESLHALMIDTGAQIVSKTVNIVDAVEAATGLVEDANNSIRNTVNNQCAILAKKYTDTVGIRQKKYNELTVYTALLKEEQIQCGANLSERLDTEVQQLSDELCNHGAFCSLHESHVSTELEQCREGFKKFFGGGIKDYKQTGVTPVRKRYRYPKHLLQTKPHDQLVEEYYCSQSQSARVSDDEDDEVEWDVQNICSSPEREHVRDSDLDGNRIEPLTENNAKKDKRSLIPRPGENHFGNVNN